LPKGIPKDGRKPGNPKITEISKNTRMTREQAIENGRKGKSAQTIIKSFREYFEDNLANTNSNGDTVKDGITRAIIKKALNGDAQAAQLVMRMVGELPSDKVNVSVSKIDTAELDALESVVLNDTRTSDSTSS